jgi:hypothetical protein
MRLASRGRWVINRPSSTATSSILAVFLALLPSTAMADCQAWELLHKFSAVQDNGYNVVFEVDVANGKVTGSAHYFTGDDFHRVNGDVNGDFDGQGLHISVWWPATKALGQYDGLFDSIDETTAHLKGITKDLQDPERKGANPEVYWRSKQIFPCAPKPVKILGKKKLPPSPLDEAGVLKQPSDRALEPFSRRRTLLRRSQKDSQGSGTPRRLRG